MSAARGGAGGNGKVSSSNGIGGAGGNGGAGGTGAGYGGALFVTSSSLTISDSSFGASGQANQVVGGAGGAGGIGGTIGTFGHSSLVYALKNLTGDGGQGGQGASAYGGALAANSSATTIQIAGSTFTANAITSGNGGAGGEGGIFSADGKYAGLNGQGGAGGLAQGGAVSLAATTSQSATLSNDAFTANSASGGNGGAGTINEGQAGAGSGQNGFGSNGGNGGLVHGVGLADVNYNLDLISSSFSSGTGTGGNGGSGGGSTLSRPYTWRGGNGGDGGSVLGGGVFVSNNSSGTLTFNVNGGSASTNSLIGGNGGGGGNAGASGHASISGGAGGGGGFAQGGGLYILAASSSVNTTNISNLTLTGNDLGGGNGGGGGAGFNAIGGSGGTAQGGGVFSSSLNGTASQSSSFNLAGSTLSDNQANGGTGGDAGSGTTPNGGAGGAGGAGGNADGAGLYDGKNMSLMVVNTTFGGSSDSNVLSGGRGGSGGDAGTPTGVPFNKGGGGGAGGGVSGGNIFNSSNADFINDTIVYGQAIASGVGGSGGSGAGKAPPGVNLNGNPGDPGVGSGGGYFAAAGTNSVGNTILDLNTASSTSMDANGAFTSLGNNILGSTAGATGFSTTTKDQFGVTAAQLNLGPLQNNGGLTSTDALLNNGNGKSIAIDAGGDTLVTSTSNKWNSLFENDITGQASDQRGFGFLRIYNGKVDVGAFELQNQHVVPAITGMSWSTNQEGQTNVQLTITGTSFASGATVDFGGAILTPTPGNITSTSISVTVPGPLPDAEAGPISVTVDNPDGSGVAGETVDSAPVQFAITEAPFSLVNPGTQNNNESDSVSLTIAPGTPDSVPDVGNFSASGLPAGLSINAATGAISGTIGAYDADKAPYTVTVTAYDGPLANKLLASTTFTWNVTPITPPSFTNPGTQNNKEGDSVTVKTVPVETDAGSITAKGLPPGLSIDSTTGVISGTIDAYDADKSPYTVTVSATRDETITNSITFTWNVAPTTPPSFTNPGTQNSKEGDSVTVKTAPFEADAGSITATGLPQGLSIDATTGVITGTIGAYDADKSPYTVTVTATRDKTITSSITFTWNVSAVTPPGFTISTQNNKEGDTVSVSTKPVDADAGSITATGLPQGLSIDSTSGVITGTIGAYDADKSPYTVTVTATRDGTIKGSTTFTWNVSPVTPPAFTITTQNNKEGDTLSVPTNPVDADKGSITATGLPQGLSINSTTGVISGTIGAYDSDHSPYTVTISATRDGTIKGSITFTWNVSAVTPPSFTIGTQTDAEGATVSVNTKPFEADSGSITASGLPDGLSINATTGVISGTIGKYDADHSPFTVTVSATRDGTIKGSTTFTWNVVAVTPPTFSVSTQSDKEGDSVSVATSPVDADASSITATGLPPGLSIDPTTGLITGTIGAFAGDHSPYTVTVSATRDKTITGSITFTWNVSVVASPSFTNPGTQNSNEGDTVNLSISPVDADPGSITATGLPPGLTINSNTGVISGTIDSRGTGSYSVSVNATRNGTIKGVTAFNWNVADSTPPALSNPGAQNSNENTGVNLGIQAVDADSFSASGLPPGLSINARTGVISGTIFGASGTYHVTVIASDGGVASSVTFPWKVNEVPISVAITNVQYTYVGLYQVETVTAQVTNPQGIGINEGSITFEVNGETLTAPVNNGVATVTFATPMISLDLTILLNDFFAHTLSAVYGDSASIFGSGSSLFSDPGMLFGFVVALQGGQFASLAQQLDQSQS